MPVKIDGGVAYHADAYLHVPDKAKPTTWKLRIKERIGGAFKVTKEQLGRAAATLGPGFRGQRVQLAEGAIKGIKGKLRSLYRSVGVKTDWIPYYLKEQTTQPDNLLFEGRIEDLFEGPLFPNGEKAKVDEATGTVHGMAMLGPVSSNNRKYSAKVMGDAVNRGIYESLPCYIDHNPDRRTGRRVRDLVGRWINVRYDETTQRVRGDLKTLEQHRPLVMDIAKNGPELAAPSHVVEGRTRKVKENNKVIEYVDHIAKGYSVDLVAGAATIASLMEGKDKEQNTMDWKDITLEEIQTARPDLIESIKADTVNTDNSGLEKILKEVRDENRALKASMEKADADIKAKKAQDESNVIVAAALKESKLPDPAKAELASMYKGTVLTEEQIKKVVENHVAYLEKVGVKLTESTVNVDHSEPTPEEDDTRKVLREGFLRNAGIVIKEKKEDK